MASALSLKKEYDGCYVGISLITVVNTLYNLPSGLIAGTWHNWYFSIDGLIPEELSLLITLFEGPWRKAEQKVNCVMLELRSKA